MLLPMALFHSFLWLRSILNSYIYIYIYVCVYDFKRNAGLNELQVGIKIGGNNTNNLIYVDDTTLMAESEEEPLDEGEGGE